MRLNAMTFRHPRLRTVLAVSALVQLLVAIALVGYLSYRTSTDAIETLADRVLEQVTDRVIEHLGHFTTTPKVVTQINEDGLKNGTLDSGQQCVAVHELSGMFSNRAGFSGF